MTPDHEEMTARRARERRLRLLADQQGLILARSRRRDPRALTFGRYWLVTPHGGTVLGGGFGTDLGDVARYLGVRGLVNCGETGFSVRDAG